METHSVEEKIFLIDWIGYSWVAKHITFRGIGGHLTHIDEFDPWNHPEHFKEVWNKLTKDQKQQVIYGEGTEVDVEDTIDEFLNSLPKVVQDVIDVLRDTKLKISTLGIV